MYRHITDEHVEVQVERTRTDVWVPDGLAVERRNYPAGGIKFDPATGLAFMKDTVVQDVPDNPDWLMVSPKPNRKIAHVSRITTSTGRTDAGDRFVDSVRAYNDMSIGPVLCQNRIPIPVAPGMRVDWSGTFQLRSTGTHEDDRNGGKTNLFARAELWGTGTVVDAYGVESDVKVRLKTFTERLQVGSELVAPIYTLPATGWVEVPANVDSVYLSISLYGSGDYQSGSYVVQRWGAQKLAYFASPRIGSTSYGPLTVRVSDPANAHPTHPNPLSRTGFVFRNRSVFTNVPPNVEVTLCSPVAGTAATVEVREYDGLEPGVLIAVVPVPAGGRVTQSVTSTTGSIALVSADEFDVESVLAPLINTRRVEQTRVFRYEYDTVTDPVNEIKTKLVEADLGVSTIRFVSATVDGKLRAGRRVRVLALHDGRHTPLVSAPIRARRKVRTIDDTVQVEVALHDAFSALGAACPVTYDQLREFGMMVHRLGVPVSIDGVDFTGPAGPLPDGHAYFPSYHSGNQSMRDALLMARNTHKAYLFVDRTGRVQLTSSLPDEIALEVSDMPGQGAMSYADRLDLTTDTSNLITTVQVVEHMLDRDDYVDARQPESEDPPILFGPIAAKTQRIDYRRATAIDTYGETKVTLPVVRGSGSWADINADNFGPPFADWAARILDEYAVERETVDGLVLPVRAREIGYVAALQPLDAVAVRAGGSAIIERIREITHEIGFDQGTGLARWVTRIDFTVDSRGRRTLWLPPEPNLADPPIVGGWYNDVGQGSYDGGTPASTGVGVIDGGEL